MFLKKNSMSVTLRKQITKPTSGSLYSGSHWFSRIILSTGISSFARGVRIQRADVASRCRVDSVQLQWGSALVTGQAAKV